MNLTLFRFRTQKNYEVLEEGSGVVRLQYETPTPFCLGEREPPRSAQQFSKSAQQFSKSAQNRLFARSRRPEGVESSDLERTRAFALKFFSKQEKFEN